MRIGKRWLARAEPIRQTLRELGWLNACLYALDRLLARTSRRRARFHKYYFVAQPISKKPWLSSQRGATVEVRQVTASDPIVREFPRPDWAIPYRFNQGAICLAGFKSGQLIGFLWFTLGPYQEDVVNCRYVPLPAGKSAWDFDVYLDPQHRNGVAFLKLWDEANRFLVARDIRWSLSRISAFNKQSMSSHARMGARCIGVASFLTMASYQLSMATVRPYFHFSRHPDSFPIFTLDPERTHGNEPAR